MDLKTGGRVMALAALAAVSVTAVGASAEPARVTIDSGVLAEAAGEALASLPYQTRPAVDDRLFKELVSQAFAVGHNSDVPLIIGSNTYEVSLLEALKIPPTAILGPAPTAPKAIYADLASGGRQAPYAAQQNAALSTLDLPKAAPQDRADPMQPSSSKEPE